VVIQVGNAGKEYDNEKESTPIPCSKTNYFFTILYTEVKYRLTVIKWQWAESIKGTCTSVLDYITEPNYTSYLWLTVMTILDTIQAVFSLQPPTFIFNSKASYHRRVIALAGRQVVESKLSNSYCNVS